MTTNINKVHRYPSELQLKFPEGLDEIRFLSEIDGFNYLSIKQNETGDIVLPDEFEEVELPAGYLKEIRQEQYKKAENLRKDHQFKTIIYNDIELSVSQMARQNMTSIVSTQDSPDFTDYWKDVNEKVYQFTLSDFKEILKVISARDTELYYVEAQVKKEIDLKLSKTSLQEFNLTDSWTTHEEACRQEGYQID